jgi:hypothetical protein
MITINRTAIMVRPGQPFLDWLQRADPTSNELSLEDLRREATVYLLPEFENEEAAREYLGKVCGQIFEEQFDGGYRAPSSCRTGVYLPQFGCGWILSNSISQNNAKIQCLCRPDYGLGT